MIRKRIQVLLSDDELARIEMYRGRDTLSSAVGKMICGQLDFLDRKRSGEFSKQRTTQSTQLVNEKDVPGNYTREPFHE